jgi:hypothetical protein
MSLHSSGMFLGAAQEAAKKGKKVLTLKATIGLFAFYNIVVITSRRNTGQWPAALYFFMILVGTAGLSRSIRLVPRVIDFI